MERKPTTALTTTTLAKPGTRRSYSSFLDPQRTFVLARRQYCHMKTRVGLPALTQLFVYARDSNWVHVVFVMCQFARRVTGL